MKDEERLRLLSLLNSVEKEEREVERTAIIERDLLRRQLFVGETFQDDDENGNVDFEGSDDDEGDVVEESEHEPVSEMSTEDLAERLEADCTMLEENEDGNLRTAQEQVFILGKDETQWSAHADVALLRGRIRQQNIIRAERSGVRLPCPKGIARSVKSPIEAWKLFFPDEFIEKVVVFTNIWIRKNRGSYSRERDAKETDKDEMHAVFGLLYLAGLLKTSHTNLDELWAADGFGVDYFRATMSLRRLKFLLRAMRFDDLTTRRQRQALDKLAPIRELFEEFVSRCQESYALSEYITIDEMLESFRGRCAFKQYIPKKPAKYGVKLFAMCDARTFYTHNLEIYAGKNQRGPFHLSNSARDVVLRLIQPVSGTGRHLTMDNWFMTVPLARELYNNHRITVVGTLRKNKPEIPAIFIDGKIRPPLTSLFAYQNECTLVSYIPRKSKVVLLLSTFHHSDEIDVETGDKNNPLILTSYNKYKGGVDTVDQMKQAYFTGKKTNRWTMRVFFSLLDIGGINSFVILRNNTVGELVRSRRVFIKSLVKDLCTQHMIKRLSVRSTKTITRDLIKTILGQPVRPALEEGDNEPRSGRCYVCGRVKNRKSTTRCSSCRYFICREHTKFTCAECAGERPAQHSSEEDVI